MSEQICWDGKIYTSQRHPGQFQKDTRGLRPLSLGVTDLLGQMVFCGGGWPGWALQDVEPHPWPLPVR